MKTKLTALLLAMMLLLAACQPTYNENDPEKPNNNPSTEQPTDPADGPNDPGDPETDPNLSEGTPETDPVAAGVAVEKLAGLSNESKGWGPGGPKDDKNRSQSALMYNESYGKYNAVFISEDSEEVYMTFDEGYEFGLSGNILDTLKQKGVKAMFFVTGDFAKMEPELVQRMIDEGHTVGNHSWSHKNYPDLTVEELEQDAMKLHDYMKENFNYSMRYFRFPSGNFSERAMAEMQQLGYKSVFWSFAYKDWLTDDQPEKTAAQEKIVKDACPGMIYLLHAVSQTNADILGDVIDEVRAKGFTWGDPAKL